MEEIKQEPIDIETKLLQVENENALLRKKLQKSRIRNKELNSQSKRFKEAILFLIFEVEANGQDVINTINTLENELDVKTDDQSKVRDRVAAVKIPVRKKNKHVKIESIEGEQNIDEFSKYFEGVTTPRILMTTNRRPRGVSVTIVDINVDIENL